MRAMIVLNRVRARLTDRAGGSTGTIALVALAVVGLAAMTLSPAFSDLTLRAIDRVDRGGFVNAQLNPFRTRTTLMNLGLPVYDLKIVPSEYAKILEFIEEAKALNTIVPDDMEQWVEAEFTHDDRTYNVDVRVRGHQPLHWAGVRKSWRIEFDKNDLFDGQRELNLIVTDDSKGVEERFTNAVFNKLGVTTLKDGFAVLRLNGVAQGVFYQSEHITPEMFESNELPAGTVFSNSRRGLELGSFKERITEGNQTAWRALQAVLEHEQNPTPENFRRACAVTDMQNFLAYTAGQTLFCSCHTNFAGDNYKLYFHPARGQFQRIPWDVQPMDIPVTHLYEMEDARATFDVFWWTPMGNFRIWVLLDDELRLQRNRMLWNLVKDSSLMALFDETYAGMDLAFWSDVMGIGFERERLAQFRSLVSRNASAIRRVLERNNPAIRVEYRGNEALLEFSVNNASGVVWDELAVVGAMPGERFQLVREGDADGEEVAPVRDVAQCVIDESGNATFKPDQKLLARADVHRHLPVYPLPGGPGRGNMTKPLRTVVYSKTNRVRFYLRRPEGQVAGVDRPWPELEFALRNAVTDATIDKDQIEVRTYNATDDFIPGRRNLSADQFRASSPSLAPRVECENDTCTITLSGPITLTETTVVPSDIDVQILPGTHLRLEPGVSLVAFGTVTAQGTQQQPIRISAASDAPWGTLAVVDSTARNRFSHVHVSGGAGATVEGILFTGAMAVHGADADLANCSFTRCPAEDAVNLKSGDVSVTSCTFAENSSDGIDLDFVTGSVTTSAFSDHGGDGIDVSGSTVTIQSCRIERSADKGISIGEASQSQIIDTVVADNAIGIAVKDRSTAAIAHCTLIGNDVTFAAYQKKPVFGGGAVRVDASVILESRMPVLADDHSTVTIAGSILPAHDADGCPGADDELSAQLRGQWLVTPDVLLESGCWFDDRRSPLPGVRHVHVKSMIDETRAAAAPWMSRTELP